jgi:hypothetical protein
MIRIAIIIAIAGSATACTSQANVPYSSKKITCTKRTESGSFDGKKFFPINVDVCIPDTPYKSCLQYLNHISGQFEVRCTPLTRKSPTAEGRARQLAGSKYP